MTRLYFEIATGLPTTGTRKFDGYGHSFIDVTDRPSPTIVAARPIRIAIEESPLPAAATRYRKPVRRPAPKPPYAVPTMAEIAATPWNGYTAVSTFSGCGGNATGYRIAGYRMAWSNEFVPAAQDTYRANAAPYTVLDGRDVREISGADLLAGAGLGHGEIDLFDGSPPCASFSTAGKREEGWGQERSYSDTVQRSDDLFFEFARLIRETQPRTFVGENVSGLVKGVGKGYFLMILAKLRSAGYRVEAKLLDASWLGVPQARQRLIFVGVREDLELDPVFPTPLPYQYTVRDALPWLALQARGLAAWGPDGGSMKPTDYPSQTFGASPQTGNGYWTPSTVLGPPDGDPDAPPIDPETQQRLTVGGKIGERANASAAAAIKTNKGLRSVDEPSPTVLTHGNAYTQSELALSLDPGDGVESDPETGHSLALRRYDEGDLRVRRLTLGELRALSGFPSDFVLTGTYAQRWERIGRAVPPVMMSHIATAVRDGVLNVAREKGRI